MTNEGAKQEELQLVKDEAEKNLTTVWDDITYALDEWLQKITMLEQRQLRVSNLQDRISRTLQQIQQDGLISIYDFGTLTYIGQVWIDLINLISSTTAVLEKNTKRLIIQDLLKLYDAQQISYELLVEIIIQL